MIGVQLGLQIQTGHSRHPDIGDQTRRPLLLAGRQEFLGRRERLRRQAHRFQQALQCAAHQIIVIDNRDNLGLPLNIHKRNMPRRQKWRNYALV